MPIRTYTPRNFLQSYELSLYHEQDFASAGVPASYAPGHPKEWGQEMDGFDFWDDVERHFGAKSGKSNGDKVCLLP